VTCERWLTTNIVSETQTVLWPRRTMLCLQRTLLQIGACSSSSLSRLVRDAILQQSLTHSRHPCYKRVVNVTIVQVNIDAHLLCAMFEEMHVPRISSVVNLRFACRPFANSTNPTAPTHSQRCNLLTSGRYLNNSVLLQICAWQPHHCPIPVMSVADSV
jgi:hypothetical protein